MDSLRSASVASNFGEMRLRFVCPSVRVAGERDLRDLWRDELRTNGGDVLDQSTCSGALEKELKGLDCERGASRRDKRLDLIVHKMVNEKLVDKNDAAKNASAAAAAGAGKAEAEAEVEVPTRPTSNSTVNVTMGFKVVIQFRMDEMEEHQPKSDPNLI